MKKFAPSWLHQACVLSGCLQFPPPSIGLVKYKAKHGPKLHLSPKLEWMRLTGGASVGPYEAWEKSLKTNKSQKLKCELNDLKLRLH